MSVRTGRFITLEGGEGVGKSTQARLLAEWLESEGHSVIVTREPGGTDGAEAIRGLLLTGEHDRWNSVTEALLVAAARSDHVTRVILPALKAGKWVICDRFLDSTLAYQGGDGGLADETILSLHDIAASRLRPDITFVLTLEEQEARARANQRDSGQSDRIGSKDAAYHQRINTRFIEAAKRDPQRCHIVDAQGSPDDVHMQLRSLIGAVSQ